MNASVLATFYALLTVVITGLQNITIRLAADDGAHSFQIVLFRNLFGLISVVAIILWTERTLPRSRYTGLIAFACIAHVISMFSGYYGIAVLPLNESAALGFAMPLFATIGAALFLGETVRARRWSAVAAGFVGVLIILRPGIIPFELGAAMVLVSAMLGAFITLIFKYFTGGERATTLIFRKFKNTGRVARNVVSDEVVEISARPDSVFEDIRPLVSGAKGRQALESGDLSAGLVWAGQCQGLIHDIPTCADLISRMVADAEAIISGRLAGMVRA